RRRWVAVIRADLAALVGGRALHARARAALAAQDEALAGYLDGLRSQTLALGIRRQLKTDSRSITLAGLVADLVGRGERGDPLATVLSHPDAPGHVGAEDDLRDALRVLKARAQPAESYADRGLAHADRRTPPVPEREELEGVLDDVLGLFRQVALMVEGPRSDHGI
ncbi:MAG: hypothetical protein ACRELX_05520, partial [Longimicrobiales bacterium]